MAAPVQWLLVKLATRTTVIAVTLALAGLLALARLLGEVGLPFAGFMVGPHGVVGFRDPPSWTGPRAGLKPGDRITAVQGQPVPDNGKLQEVAGRYPPGTPLAYRLQGGRQVNIPTMRMGLADVWWVFGIGAIGGLVHLALGYVVARARPASLAARAHWRYCVGIAIFFLSMPLGFVFAPALMLNYLSATLLLVPITDLATSFPVDLPRLRRFLRLAGGAVAALDVAAICWGAWDPYVEPIVFKWMIVPPILALGLLVALWTWQAIDRRNAPQQRAQARVVGLGMVVAMAPASLYSLAQVAGLALPALDLSMVTLTAFPAAMAYAILRYGLLDVSHLVRQVALYTALSTLLGAVYLAAAAGGGLLIGHEVAPGVGALALAVALGPLHARLRRVVERGRMGSDGALGLLASFGARAGNTRELEAALVEATQRLLGAAWASLEPGNREAVLAVPLEAAGQDLGTLAVGPRLVPRPYTDEERALVRALAAQAALGIQHARLAEAQVQLRVREELASALAEQRAALVRQLVHDLATDLSNLSVAMELAKEDPSAPRPWATMRRSLQHMEAFLAEKRGQVAGQAPARSCDAGPVLAELCDRPDVDWTRDPGDMHVALGEVELRQVLANVLDNARKFSPPGGRVRVQVRPTPAALVVEVADQGPGVAPELLATPGDGRRGDHGVAGSGLGLANAIGLLEGAGGTLAWRNADRGAVVSLELPRAVGQ
jgi:signal transduction histidine kinase